MNTSTTDGTILVLDDCRQLRELMEIILVRNGYEVLTAADGAEALKIARRTPKIDLLVSDIEMPGMAGGELADRFAELHPLSAIVFVSSWIGRIETSVPYEFLAKPFTIAELRDTMRHALRARPVLEVMSSAA